MPKLDGLLPELKSHCDKNAIDLCTNQLKALMGFLNLLLRWNDGMNLVARATPSIQLRRHIVDCLTLHNHLQPGTLLDLGSGAGLPGIPLAISRPEIMVTLIESKAKKVRFLQAAKTELNMKNLEIVHGRVEDYHPQVKFDNLAARAFGSIHTIIRLGCRLIDDNGIFLLPKGADISTEIADLSPNWKRKIQSIPVKHPESAGHRQLLIINNSRSIQGLQ